MPLWIVCGVVFFLAVVPALCLWAETWFDHSGKGGDK